MKFQDLQEAARASKGIPTVELLEKIQEAVDSEGIAGRPSLSVLKEAMASRPPPAYGQFHFEPYQYSPLPKATSIRLLQVLGKDSDGLTRCSLVTVDLNDGPVYLCLSYTWGNPHAKGTLFTWSEEMVSQYSSKTRWPISCDDKLLYVTQNLYDALD